MNFQLLFTDKSEEQFNLLKSNPAFIKRFKSVRKALGLMETNIRHLGLNTHKFHSLQGPNGEEVFESYTENNTPGAYRIFWCYGPNKKQITILGITSHP